MAEQSFRTPVFVGHKDTYAVNVPFDPAEAWPDVEPMAMSLDDDPRGGLGWPVSGTINAVHFDGFVGHRYGRGYIVLSPALRAEADIADGAEVEVKVRPRSAQ